MGKFFLMFLLLQALDIVVMVICYEYFGISRPSFLPEILTITDSVVLYIYYKIEMESKIFGKKVKR